MRLGASLPEDESEVASKRPCYLKNPDDGRKKERKKERKKKKRKKRKETVSEQPYSVDRTVTHSVHKYFKMMSLHSPFYLPKQIHICSTFHNFAFPYNKHKKHKLLPKNMVMRA